MANAQPDHVSKPTFSATLFCPHKSQLSLTKLYDTLKSIAPSAVLGDWSGSLAPPLDDARGTKMISLDGVPLALLAIDAPLPPDALRTGPCPNLMMLDARDRLASHKAHMVVAPANIPGSKSERIAAARAVTLVVWAAAILEKAEAFRWNDAGQIVPTSAFQHLASTILLVDGHATPVWIRLLAAMVPLSEAGSRMIVGTAGLWAFGIPDIEFEPHHCGLDYSMPRASAVSEYLLTTTKAVSSGDNIQIGREVFKVEQRNTGAFADQPVFRLSNVL